MRARWLLVGVFAVACANEPAPPPSEAWIEDQLVIPGTPRHAILLVVDDRPGPNADEVRRLVREGLLASLVRLTEAWHGDPARDRPSDWRVVVAKPSATASARWGATRSLVARRADVAAVEALVSDIASDLSTDAPPATFRPLAAAHDLTTLVTGVRPPSDLNEQRIVDAAQHPDFVSVVVAASTDDESADPATAYVLPYDERVLVTGMFPSADPENCWPLPKDGGRVLSWLTANYSHGRFGLPCAATDVLREGVLGLGHFDGVPWGCLRASRPIATDPNGAALCSVVARPDNALCDPTRGWRDTEIPGVCEVQQLSGEEREACRRGDSCENCGSGWCVHTGDIARRWGCEHPWMRFTGGAAVGVSARIEVTCELER